MKTNPSTVATTSIFPRIGSTGRRANTSPNSVSSPFESKADNSETTA